MCGDDDFLCVQIRTLSMLRARFPRFPAAYAERLQYKSKFDRTR